MITCKIEIPNEGAVISQYLHDVTTLPQRARASFSGSELRVESHSPRLCLLLEPSLARLEAWGWRCCGCFENEPKELSKRRNLLLYRVYSLS